MEKTLLITLVNPNSNNKDYAFEIPNNEDNLGLFNDFSGTTLADCTAYFEGKGFVENTSGGIIEGDEYRVWDRPKIAR